MIAIHTSPDMWRVCSSGENANVSLTTAVPIWLMRCSFAVTCTYWFHVCCSGWQGHVPCGWAFTGASGRDLTLCQYGRRPSCRVVALAAFLFTPFPSVVVISASSWVALQVSWLSWATASGEEWQAKRCNSGRGGRPTSLLSLRLLCVCVNALLILWLSG